MLLVFFLAVNSCKEVESRRNDYRNQCIDLSESIPNELVKLETLDRSWRAFRLGACIAVLEHPENLNITLPDYEWAVCLTDKWGNQFREFVEGESNLDIEQIYNFILAKPGTSKTILRRKTNAKSTADLNYKINQLKLIADENDKMLIQNKGRGIAEYYSIIDRPKHYDDIDSIYKLNKDQKFIEALIEKYGHEAVDDYLKLNQK